MHDILYLHGFGELQPEQCPVAQALRTALPAFTAHTPCYHPEGQIEATRVGKALKEFSAIIEKTASGRVHVVGYSFGGLLAAILASEQPDRVASVLLLAPAIDNVARNYEGRAPEAWWMPREFVEELKLYPARPHIVRPTILVHGTLDNDDSGAAVWRVQEWASVQEFSRVLLLDGLDHSLQPWLSATAATSATNEPTPGFHQLLSEWAIP